MCMRSRVAMAIVAALLLLPAGAFSQMRGGGGGRVGGGGFHGGMGGGFHGGGFRGAPGGFHGAPGGMGFRGGPAFRGGFAPGGRGIARGGFPRFRGGNFCAGFGDGDCDFDDGFFFRHHHRHFFFNTFGFFPYAYYPYGYGYPAYPIYADYSPRSYDVPAETANNNAVSDAYQQGALQQQIADLQSEVRQMRSDLATQREPAPAPVRSERSYEPPVTLVFRDGHRTDVSNYAIAGNTFWIVNQRTARKVAMSDLDLAATKRVNAENGVELEWLR